MCNTITYRYTCGHSNTVTYYCIFVPPGYAQCPPATVHDGAAALLTYYNNNYVQKDCYKCVEEREKQAEEERQRAEEQAQDKS